MTDIHDNSPWAFTCPVCELPFMQSAEFHAEEYHGGAIDGVGQ